MAENVGGANVEISIDDSKARRGLSGLLGTIKDFGRSAKSVFIGTLTAGAAMKAISVVKTGIGSLVKAGMDYNATQDKMRATWTVLAGSASKGKQMVDMINGFQVRTGYATETLNEMEQKIYHIKSSASETQTMTRAFTTLGDAMGLSDDRLTGVSEQFSQMMSTGRAYAGDLNIMTDAFPAFGEAIQKTTGKSMGTIRQLASQGKLSSQVVEDTLIDMSKKYSNATEMAMSTTQGLWRTIQSNWGRISGTMLKPIFNLKKSGLKDLSDFLSGDQVTNFAKSFGNAIAGVIGGVVDLSTEIASSLDPLISAFSEGFTNGFVKMQTDAETFAAYLGNAFYNLISILGKAKTAIVGVFSIATGNEGQGVSILTSLGLSPAQIQQVINAINTIKAYLLTSLNNMVTGIKTAGQFIIAAWNIIWPYLKPAVVAIFNFVKSIISQIVVFWKQNGTVIMQAIQNVMTVILAILRVAMPVIAFIVRTVWDNVKGIIQGALNIIMGIIKIFSGLFTGNWGTMWSGIKQLFMGAIQFIWNLWNLMFLGKIFGAIKSFAIAAITNFQYLFYLAKDIFFKLGSSVKESVSGMVSSVIKNVVNMWQNVQRTWLFLRSFGEGLFSALRHTVSSIFVNLWHDAVKAVQSMLSGVRGGFNSIKTATYSVFNSIKSHVSGVWNDIVNGAKALPGRIGNGIKSMAGKAVSGVKSMANGLAKAVGSGINGVIGGIDWVLDKIGVKGKISKWKVPQYKSGTDGHPDDGPAVVGDGGLPELGVNPDGSTWLSPARSTLTWLKKGTQVIAGPMTKQILSGQPPFPHYATGIGSLASNIWSYITHPSKLLGAVLSGMGVKIPDMAGLFGKVAKGSFSRVKNAASDFVKNKLNSFGLGSGSVSGSVASWLSKALAITNTPMGWLSGLEQLVQAESGGNPHAVNKTTVMGQHATGLLQMLPSTFRANMMNGLSNIWNPIHNAVAAIRYIKSRYGSIFNTPLFHGGHYVGYANGTRGHKGGDAVLGDGGQQEPFITPDGKIGLSPSIPTLFRKLPRGTQIWPSIKAFMDQIPHYADGIHDLVNRSFNLSLLQPNLGNTRQLAMAQPQVNVYVTGDNHFEYETDADDFSNKIAINVAQALYRKGERPS